MNINLLPFKVESLSFFKITTLMIIYIQETRKRGKKGKSRCYNVNVYFVTRWLVYFLMANCIMFALFITLRFYFLCISFLHNAAFHLHPKSELWFQGYCRFFVFWFILSPFSLVSLFLIFVSKISVWFYIPVFLPRFSVHSYQCLFCVTCSARQL